MDYIDPAFAWPLIVILWVLLIVITLVSLRRAKIKRDKQRRREEYLRRRETYIAVKNNEDEAYVEQLRNGYTPRVRRYRNPEGNKK